MTQFLGERWIATKKQLAQQLTAWAADRNNDQKVVTWRFTTKRAQTILLQL